MRPVVLPENFKGEYSCRRRGGKSGAERPAIGKGDNLVAAVEHSTADPALLAAYHKQNRTPDFCVENGYCLTGKVRCDNRISFFME